MNEPKPATEADFAAFQAWVAAGKPSAAPSNADQAAEAAKPAEYYVWLADGNTVIMGEQDAMTSHVDGIKVINRFQVGE